MDNADRLRCVPLVQTHRLPKSTSLLPDNSEALLPAWLVQTYLLHKSTSLLPDCFNRLPRVMFLWRARMYLFTLVMILCTHKWYMIQVYRIMTVCRWKGYLIHCIIGPWQSKTNLLPGAFARHPTLRSQVSHFQNYHHDSSSYLLPYEIPIGALY